MIKLAILEKSPGFFTKHFSGPIRVVYELCREWEKTGKVEVITLSNDITTLFHSRSKPYFQFIRRTLLLHKARTSHFDILNIHGVSREGVEIAKICSKRRIPIVYTAHGAAYKERDMGYAYSDEFIHDEESLISLADQIVTVSPWLKELLVDEYRLPDEKVDVIYNGVDPNFGRRNYRKIDVRKKYCIPKNRKILLNVGGTANDKGIPFLIEALTLLKREDWHLVLVGREGTEHEKIMQECTSKLKDHFAFTGVLEDNELLSFYHQARLYISTGTFESFGLAPLEALSCGTDAVVRSTVAAARQYFCSIPNLVKRHIFDTPEELADVITSYMEGRHNIEGELLRRILQHHSWENRAWEYLQIFRQLVENNKFEDK